MGRPVGAARRDAMDHYRTLGVPRDASPEAIRDAFRALSRRHHPDAAGKGEAARFQAAKAAYDVLRDPEARAKYDAELGVAGQVGTPHFTWSNIAQPRAAGGPRGGEDRPDLDTLIDAFFGRWNEPEPPEKATGTSGIG